MEQTINQNVQNTLNKMEGDCKTITAKIDALMAKDGAKHKTAAAMHSSALLMSVLGQAGKALGAAASANAKDAKQIMSEHSGELATLETNALKEKCRAGHLLTTSELAALEASALQEKVLAGHLLTTEELAALEANALDEKCRAGHLLTTSELDALETNAVREKVRQGHLLTTAELARLDDEALGEKVSAGHLLDALAAHLLTASSHQSPFLHSLHPQDFNFTVAYTRALRAVTRLGREMGCYTS